MNLESDARASVRDYYGRVLEKSEDLKTSACCVAERPPPWLRSALGHIHPDVTDRFYGCGFPIAEAVRGATVLDLGCGTGRDVYLFAQLVGPEGFVHGIDMTAEQLEVARRTAAWHQDRFGYARTNVAFHEGFIEELQGIEDDSIDLVVSNCVLNLSPRKDLVLQEVYRVLKPGGEFLFSDVFADRRLPAWMMEDPILLGECLGGALYTRDFQSLARRAGFRDPRALSSSPIELHDEEVVEKVGTARFVSTTWRLFKLEDLDDACEDYGQVATYVAPIDHIGPLFVLDDHHAFELGRPERICGNTAAMLGSTRFAPHFRIDGNMEVHYGAFECTATIARPPSERPAVAVSGPSCC